MFAFRDLGSDCGDSPVTASFEQHAGHVTGFLRTQGGGCTLAGDVAANIVGDVIQGAFTSGYASGTVYGHVSATRVTLQVVPRQDPDSGSSSPGGSTVLSRR
jgi:hypothetical protein